jgi:hypothetical protein
MTKPPKRPHDLNEWAKHALKVSFAGRSKKPRRSGAEVWRARGG